MCVYIYNVHMCIGMYILKDLLIDVINFYGSVIISRKHLKQFICQGHCVHDNYYIHPI